MSSLPPLLNPYCSVRDVQREAQNDDPSVVADIITEINKASRWIDGHCRRDFLFHDHASVALRVDESWCAGNVIYLPWPIITLTEVMVGDAVIPATEYRHYQRPGAPASKIERNGNWLPDPALNTGGVSGNAVITMAPAIQLKGTFGYTPAEENPTTTPAPTLPAEISQACATIAAINSGLVRREIIGYGGTREAVTTRNMPAVTLKTLARYKIPVV